MALLLVLGQDASLRTQLKCMSTRYMECIDGVDTALSQELQQTFHLHPALLPLDKISRPILNQLRTASKEQK